MPERMEEEMIKRQKSRLRRGAAVLLSAALAAGMAANAVPMHVFAQENAAEAASDGDENNSGAVELEDSTADPAENPGENTEENQSGISGENAGENSDVLPDEINENSQRESGGNLRRQKNCWKAK